jgi:hypothetical protein
MAPLADLRLSDFKGVAIWKLIVTNNSTADDIIINFFQKHL